MSVCKMLERIVNPRDVEARKQTRRFSSDYKLEAALHDHTFGRFLPVYFAPVIVIASDGCQFQALY